MKIIINILLLLLISKTFFAQSGYIPTVVEGNVYKYYTPMGLGQINISYQSIQCDTIISNKTYKKIYSTNYATNNNLEYYAAIREDTSTKKVYVFYKDSLQEFLMMDFSLQVNDSFIYPYNNLTTKVDSIKIENMYGANRRIFYFDAISPVIEGIGSNNWGLNFKPFKLYTQLDSFYNHGNLCYPLSTLDINDKKNINIYPTIVKNEIKLHFNSSNLILYNYKIFSLNGLIIENKKMLNSTAINISSISSGLYILQIETNEESYFTKFIKE